MELLLQEAQPRLTTQILNSFNKTLPYFLQKFGTTFTGSTTHTYYTCMELLLQETPPRLTTHIWNYFAESTIQAYNTNMDLLLQEVPLRFTTQVWNYFYSKNHLGLLHKYGITFTRTTQDYYTSIELLLQEALPRITTQVWNYLYKKNTLKLCWSILSFQLYSKDLRIGLTSDDTDRIIDSHITQAYQSGFLK